MDEKQPRSLYVVLRSVYTIRASVYARVGLCTGTRQLYSCLTQTESISDVAHGSVKLEVKRNGQEAYWGFIISSRPLMKDPTI